MTSDSGLRVEIFGASVKGPRNQSVGHPNQDAWMKAQGRFGSLAVICDGLGSRPRSHEGARFACRAVRKAVALWPGIRSRAKPVHLLRLVEILWRLALAPRGVDEFATTCLFALSEEDGHMILAGIGDGVALVRGPDCGVVRYGGRTTDNFGNETIGLGIPHKIQDWWFEVLPSSAHRAVVLASDGVSDDLRPDRLREFTDWLTAELAPLPSRVRWQRLQGELRRWPVSHHTDDKTLVVMIESWAEKICPH